MRQRTCWGFADCSCSGCEPVHPLCNLQGHQAQFQSCDALHRGMESCVPLGSPQGSNGRGGSKSPGNHNTRCTNIQYSTEDICREPRSNFSAKSCIICSGVHAQAPPQNASGYDPLCYYCAASLKAKQGHNTGINFDHLKRSCTESNPEPNKRCGGTANRLL